MARYIGVRLGWALVMVIGIVAVGFVITHILPGDPVDALVGDFPAPPDYVAQVRTEFGLDRPLYVQLWLYLVNLAHGNLGFSFLNRQPVLPLILQRAGTTLLLMIPALILASVLGILIAVRAAAHAGKLLDSMLTGLSLTGYSIPVFWLAQVLIVVFAVNLGWLPAQGIRSVRSQATGLGALFEFLKHWALPGFCITIYYLAVIARVARSSMLEMLHQDFVLTARAKGLSERSILWRHVLRNALIPVITVIGYNFGYSLTGAILTETVFAWPGLGGLFIASISNRDYPVLAAIFLLAAVAVVVANLITDLLYAVADPRVRLSPDSLCMSATGSATRKWGTVAHILLRNPAGLLSAAFIGLLLFVAAFGPLLLAGDPLTLSDQAFARPGTAHLLGTDDLGRDVLLQLVYGVRVSLFVGCVAAFATTVAGTILGSIAGYAGGWVDGVIMRIAEFFQVMPTFILAVVIVALAGPGLSHVVAVIALLSWPQTARVARGEVLRVSRLDFVDGVRCLGVPEWKILLREVIPNSIGPVVALGTLIVGNAILVEASLSFLGLSSPDLVSWGRVLSTGQRFLFTAWWLSIFPGLAIFVTVLAFNLLGDALGEVLNPRRATQ